MQIRKLRPRYLVLGGLIGLGCGIGISELCGQGPLHDRAPPPCVLDGPCLPNRATFGYYQPRWRRWPGAEAVAEPAPTEVPSPLPGTQVPDPTEEEERTRAPITPAVPLQTTPATEPPGAPELNGPTPAPTPFGGPAPGVPAPGGAQPPGALGPDSLPSAPLPTTPMPNGVGPQPDVPAAPAPSPLNPFEGAHNSSSGVGNDPPPELPSSLRTSRRLRDARRAAQAGRDSAHVADLKRLPIPRQPKEAGRDRYSVQQASATVWASGTDDIQNVDPNSGRIEQAIHHEPVD